MNYVEHHFGDYAKDTGHLSLTEHGAYRMLIDIYYVREKFLPADVKECCRLVRARSVVERRAVAAVLSEFFEKTDEGFLQRRCEAEIARYREKIEKAKSSANKRWHADLETCEGNANAMPTQCEGNAHQTPDTRHQAPKEKDMTPITSESRQSQLETDSTTEPILRANGIAPACPYRAIADAYHQELPELPAIIAMSPHRKRALQARWREVCTAEHFDTQSGLSFFRDFFRRIKQSDFLLGKAPPKRQGDRTFRADFDWIVNPANFLKIVEGRYHQRSRH